MERQGDQNCVVVGSARAVYTFVVVRGVAVIAKFGILKINISYVGAASGSFPVHTRTPDVPLDVVTLQGNFEM
ncbi:hypothetical protein J6590_093052 [Homalodisca vitripennis]|nr:hypothetical protein J6590_093052 [Homalodisca vitripennis]